MREKDGVRMSELKENLAKYLFMACALTTILALFTIAYFIFSKGMPGILKVGLVNFIFGQVWDPRQELFGIFPLIVSSFVVTFFSSFMGAYIGKWCAIFLAFYCPKKVYKFIKPMVELLAGIPSVIYGFFGLSIIVPFIRDNLGGAGKSMLAAIIILTIMVLPTIINLAESSLKTVPKNYYEGAIALGTTKHEAIFKVVVPAAKSGILSSYILGVGRALGETMAVILVVGNNPSMPKSFLSPIRTLTTGIDMEMAYASGWHQEVLFGIGIVLFVFIFTLNLILSRVSRGGN